jgi:hypothetical protein
MNSNCGYIDTVDHDTAASCVDLYTDIRGGVVVVLK